MITLIRVKNFAPDHSIFLFGERGHAVRIEVTGGRVEFLDDVADPGSTLAALGMFTGQVMALSRRLDAMIEKAEDAPQPPKKAKKPSTRRGR
jgi:hypothetical protein